MRLVVSAIEGGVRPSLRRSEWADVLGWATDGPATADPAEPGASASEPRPPAQRARKLAASRASAESRCGAWSAAASLPVACRFQAGRVAFRRADVAGWIEARRPR
jgi:hypothetical protein